MKIYTKKGDKGKTSLFGGDRVSKGHDRIWAYGHVDELNSFLGLLREEMPENETLSSIQNYLFVIGSHLATRKDEVLKHIPTLNDEETKQLEVEIDQMDSYLPELKYFILPGGDKGASLAHVCRTITRRAERAIVTLSEHEPVDERILMYLNRLSDYFFVLSRAILFKKDIKEIYWKPRS